MRRAGRIASVALCAAGWLGAMAASPAIAGRGAAAFESQQIAIATRLLFDLGVTDFDGDGDLDVFTVNHNDRQSLLANQGDGTFVDRLSDFELDQSPQFPGLEVPAAPTTIEHGMYLHRIPGANPVEGALRVTVRANPGEEVRGRIAFLFPVEVDRFGEADVSVDVDGARPLPRYVVRFAARGSAVIDLEPEQMAAPIEVRVDEAVPLSSVRVGALGVTPGARAFTLYLRDRHGMAWGDYNRDGHMDVFIARGGLRRRVGEFSGLIFDELLLGTGSSFRDATGASRIVKGSCRAREASPVDFNRDGLLDVFYGCRGARPALWRQNRGGAFSKRSTKLVRVKGEHFRWLDLNGDGREELLAARRRKLTVLRRREGRWRGRQAIRTRGLILDRPAVADFDADGDPDLFAASPQGNTLLINRHGKLRARRPGRLGMPKRGSLDASWVDYDNDGRMDLYQAPHGVFRHNHRRRFVRTGLVASQPPTLNAVASWFDSNGDGYRELLVAYPESGYSPTLFESRERDNHWLQVELKGRRGTYPAVGTRVSVRSRGRVQTQWVGQAEGSRYSHGHNRLYFGLGEAKAARWVKVVWSDGTKRKLNRVPADRLLHVTFERR